MNKDNDPIADEEFYKRLEELLEDAHPIMDDPYFDSNEHLFGKTISTHVLKNDLKITLSLHASTPSVYKDGAMNVDIRAGRGTLIKDKQYTCYVYTADYYPMCNSEPSCIVRRTNQSHVTIAIPCRRVWLPGSYILFVRDVHSSTLLRVAFTLDHDLMATLSEPVTCPLCSPDDILTSSVENTEACWDVMATTPGTAQLRQYALASRQLKIYNEFRKALSGNELKCDRNLLIYTINKDWTENVLQAFQKLAAPGNYFTYVDCCTLYNSAHPNPYDQLNEQFKATTSQVFCLTNVNALLNTGGIVIVKHIIAKIQEGAGKYKLWLCGNRQEVQSVFEVHPSLRHFFLRGNSLEQQPTTAFELVQVFFSELMNENFEITDEVKDALARAVIKGYGQGGSWELTDISHFIAEEIRPRYLQHAMRDMMNERDTLPPLTLADIDLNKLPQTTSTFEDSIHELNAMVGLDDIKRTIVTMAHQSRFFMERRHAGLRTTCNTVYHAVFTGNPGTGKTTVAKMIGKIYHSIGLLSKGDVICADRTRLVGRYIGETEENMKTVLEDARGNVLFIDEAYNLYDGASDQKDFGRKVIDSLLTVLSQPNPDMVIIFAGYEKEMDAMLTSNPGLMGRFPYKFRFPDYTADQLMEIACHLLQRDEYILENDAEDLLRQFIRDTLLQHTPNFGNARWVDQFVKNGIIPAMAVRVSQTTTKDYQHILVDDIENGYKKFNPRMIELKPRRQVGFSA